MSSVTVKLWNHCQNRCEYCVASRWIGDHSEIDFDRAIEWIKKFRPSSDIHISGGEPLLFPDICERNAIKAINEGFRVAIFTNGQNINLINNSFLDLDIFWWITWHQRFIGINDFIGKICILKNKKVFVNTILDYEPDFDLFEIQKKEFLKYGFILNPRINWWELQTSELWNHKAVVVKNIASEYITLIEANGNVYPCSSLNWGEIGNISDMTCSTYKAELINNHAHKCCIDMKKCGSFMTTQYLESIWK